MIWDDKHFLLSTIVTVSAQMLHFFLSTCLLAYYSICHFHTKLNNVSRGWNSKFCSKSLVTDLFLQILKKICKKTHIFRHILINRHNFTTQAKQTAQIIVRRLIMSRLIKIYAVCKAGYCHSTRPEGNKTARPFFLGPIQSEFFCCIFNSSY